MQENKPVLVVGLGNPGLEYARTRHNVGFMAIDALTGIDASWRRQGNALIYATNVDGRRVIFVKPQTYMNNSGMAVGALMSFYKIPVENLVVIHDEMDLAVGKVREKTGGGSAGHNGIRSIDNAAGPNYRRIRIGVGHPRDTNLSISPADWVLGRIPDGDLATLREVIGNIRLFPKE